MSHISRRTFLKTTAAAGAIAGIGASPPSPSAVPHPIGSLSANPE